MGTSTREKMCEVTSFCCGCADLRKGALIIGSLNLFFAVIQVAYNGYLLIAVQDPAVLRQLQDQGTSVEHAWLVSLILGLLVGASVIRAVVNVLLIMKAQKPGDGAGHTLPWLIFTGILSSSDSSRSLAEVSQASRISPCPATSLLSSCLTGRSLKERSPSGSHDRNLLLSEELIVFPPMCKLCK